MFRLTNVLDSPISRYYYFFFAFVLWLLIRHGAPSLYFNLLAFFPECADRTLE